MERHVFSHGNVYEPLIDFTSGESMFIRGERLTFSKDGYSAYDECFIYEFIDSAGETKAWVMPEDANDGYWNNFFRTA